MKLNDALSGLLILIVGSVIAVHARTFPSMGQTVGPSLFPTIIGGGLMVCGAALAVSWLRRRGAPWVEVDDWVRRPRMVLNFALVFVDLVFYALAVGRLGFFITAVVFLSVLMIAFGVPRARVLPVAMAVTLVMHYAFYSLLRVPLPWGVLEAVAW